jgi:glycosyltransferase involved in cell wall biosynthesis
VPTNPIRSGPASTVRILVTVTLNPNQLRSHLEPILELDEVESATLVADEPGPAIPKLRTVVPPPWLVRMCGRAAAKLLVCMAVAARDRPAWVLGYNLVPHGITAVAVARLTGARSYVHVIGGPAEWQGGGHGSDNKILGRLRRPVPAIERLLVRVLRAADVVAVMGTRARADLVARGLAPERVAVLPARVAVPSAAVAARQDGRDGHARPYDVLTASQLISRKRLHELLQAVAALRATHPGIRAAIAGRGPLAAELQAEARRLGIEDSVAFLGFVEDVGNLYSKARVFALPSQREGLSIAMTEAMAAGVPVVVTDIGEARDVVVHGQNGFLFEVGDVDAMTRHIGELLGDPDRWSVMSALAVDAVRASSSPERISAINRALLSGGAAPRS